MQHDDEEELSGLLCIGNCGEYVGLRRRNLGYRSCLVCGDKQARDVKHTIVPLPKSNYIYAHTAEDVLSPYSHKGNR
jgi:hypothetical protein